MIRTVAVIGAGNAGRSFAIACARAGFRVVLEDVMPANLRRAQDEFSSVREADDPPPLGGSASHHGSLTTALTVEDAVRTADLAIDFVPDELESKLEIFSMADRMAPPRTILLTPTDAQSIADLASCTYRADRCFALRGYAPSALSGKVMHPPSANAEARNAVMEFLHTMGYDLPFDEESAPAVAQ